MWCLLELGRSARAKGASDFPLLSPHLALVSSHLNWYDVYTLETVYARLFRSIDYQGKYSMGWKYPAHHHRHQCRLSGHRLCCQ